MHYLYTNYYNASKQNLSKLFIEIIKTFFIIVLGLSLIALTVRAVNFLELNSR